jgi:hypothetical protein
MLDSERCANCGRAIDGADQKFCPACGQSTPAHRIDWHFLGHELEHSVLHMDRGIFFTLKHLMFRPGHLIRDYIDGRRAHHVKPLMLIMITAAAVIFLTQWLMGGDIVRSDLLLGAEGAARAEGHADSMRFAETLGTVNAWMIHHFAAVTLLLLPVEAAAFKLAFRRSQKLNYPEWLVVTAFLTAQSFVLWALSIPLQRWIPGTADWMLWPMIGYAVFSLTQCFATMPRWQVALRAVLGYGVYLLMNMVLALVLVAIAVATSGRA